MSFKYSTNDLVDLTSKNLLSDSNKLLVASNADTSEKLARNTPTKDASLICKRKSFTRFKSSKAYSLISTNPSPQKREEASLIKDTSSLVRPLTMIFNDMGYPFSDSTPAPNTFSKRGFVSTLDSPSSDGSSNVTS